MGGTLFSTQNRPRFWPLNLTSKNSFFETSKEKFENPKIGFSNLVPAGWKEKYGPILYILFSVSFRAYFAHVLCGVPTGEFLRVFAGFLTLFFTFSGVWKLVFRHSKEVFETRNIEFQTWFYGAEKRHSGRLYIYYLVLVLEHFLHMSYVGSLLGNFCGFLRVFSTPFFTLFRNIKRIYKIKFWPPYRPARTRGRSEGRLLEALQNQVWKWPKSTFWWIWVRTAWLRFKFVSVIIISWNDFIDAMFLSSWWKLKMKCQILLTLNIDDKDHDLNMKHNIVTMLW